MPIDYRLVADLEEGLDDEHLSDIRFGRSRFLRNAGLALFGLAAGLVATPRESEASHQSAPYPCHGSPRCHRCRGSRCTWSGCSRAYSCSGNHCWRVAVRVGGGCRDMYQCCDWRGYFGLCICRGYLGRVC